ncbi:MAG: 23S rRNA (pseudouridine(1915)-N(3))-methyltransferase RlmH [Pseudomonadota bacterium]
MAAVSLSISAIGSCRDMHINSLIDDYLSRCGKLGPSLGFSAVQLRDGEVNKRATGQQRISEEAELLKKLSGAPQCQIVLDERGKALSTRDFAEYLRKTRDSGASSIGFLIGGADGHAAATKKSADLLLSLGPMTWPHMLARVLLCEQVYRAMSIMAGHPYHRE